jgi:uncharacterized damage-inducible protein DinB
VVSVIERVEPPYSADEATMVRAFLDYYRATIRRQADGLTPEQLATRLGPSTMTLGGMLKHLAFVEHWWLPMVLRGREPSVVWADADFDADPDWDWTSAAHDTPADLTRLYDDAIAESNALIDDAVRTDGLDLLAKRPRSNGEAPSLRWILVHLVEEYARHAGHADLIRESIDGATDL